MIISMKHYHGAMLRNHRIKTSQRNVMAKINCCITPKEKSSNRNVNATWTHRAHSGAVTHALTTHRMN